MNLLFHLPLFYNICTAMQIINTLGIILHCGCVDVFLVLMTSLSVVIMRKSLENTAPHLVWFVLENPLGKCFQRRMNKFRFRTPWPVWRKTLRQIVLWKTMLNDQYWLYSTFWCEQCTFLYVTFCKVVRKIINNRIIFLTCRCSGSRLISQKFLLW